MLVQRLDFLEVLWSSVSKASFRHITCQSIHTHTYTQCIQNVIDGAPPSMQAGLITPTTTKQMIIALEPEAASIYCRKLRMRECIPDPIPALSLSPSPSPSTGAPRYSLAGSHSTSKSSLTTAEGKLLIKACALSSHNIPMSESIFENV